MPRNFRRDEHAVTEVLGYILGFMASFILLMGTLFAFDFVATRATDTGTHAELRDLVQRSASLVHGEIEIGTKRAGSCVSNSCDADSSKTHAILSMPVPPAIRGYPYTLSLSSTAVTGTVGQRGITETATLLHYITPACGTAAERKAAPVCDFSGFASPNSGILSVGYEFDFTTNPVTNRIVMR